MPLGSQSGQSMGLRWRGNQILSLHTTYTKISLHSQLGIYTSSRRQLTKLTRPPWLRYPGSASRRGSSAKPQLTQGGTKTQKSTFGPYLLSSYRCFCSVLVLDKGRYKVAQQSS